MNKKQLILIKVRQIFRVIKYIVLGFFSLVLFYFIVAFVLSRFSIQGVDEENSTIEIFIVNTGVHTDFFFPKRNSVVNWDTLFPILNTKEKDTSLNYVAIGWGDRNFFLNTPTWDDLTLSTALKASFGLGPAALHVNYHEDVPSNFEIKRIFLSKNQYRKLVDYTLKNAVTDGKKPVLIAPPYPEIMQSNDAYYESFGSYGLFYTCNTFVNQGLIACGKRGALWTPFSGGIFDQYED
ncbi:MAG: DUF2459 domain-containing protein [Bacteroidetes bacterium]|nr:DUF2459 domain-containing protein [Bacteroidota bacterium]